MAESKEHRQSSQAGRSDRWVKIGFLVVTVVIATVIWKYLQTETFLKGWPEDLSAALADAKQTDRRVLMVFVSNPPNADAVRNADFALGKPQNKAAIQEGKFARVKVVVNSLDSDLARQYKLTHLPTMMILDPNGKELNRREGVVGEVPFLHGFLDLTEVQEPKKQ
jgi:thioredoxin-related protein